MTALQLIQFLALCPLVASAEPMSPVERTDPVSREAHRQLVEKARSGKIDLYFLGDSITRRWGCTDPEWSMMLENWRKNFHGWNAANFGWGADGVENMLWRVRNGELDGVNPKVIVILAGTNNIGPKPVGPEMAERVIGGVRTLVASCREKSPHARIILTGIVPRNDGGIEVIPTITRVNAGIASMAEDPAIDYIDLSADLARPDGTLLDGMTVDKLHLSAKGYQVWADKLNPLLEEILGPRSTEDLAPPPTGDPKLTKQGLNPARP